MSVVIKNLLTLFWLFASYIIYSLGFDAFYLFAILYVVVLFLHFPRYLLSPSAVVFAYYGIWFLIAPFFASGYSGGVLHSADYQVAFLLIMPVFVTCIVALTTASSLKITYSPSKKVMSLGLAFSVLFVTYLFCTLMLILIIINSGGFSYWMKSPGDAFLNRGGTGVFVILSHFSGFILSALTGYVAYNYKKYSVLVMFLFWLFITSPVHGSKFQIGLFFILAVSPWLIFAKIISVRAVLFSFFMVFLFVYGMILRTEGVVNFERILSYLNYFSTLHNLALLVRDFEPSFMQTWFLPFNKFLTPFGLTGGVEYYDMNHYLTDIYYPDAWLIRATEQWPVEADLYLNFYFVFGLPVLFLYFYFLGFVYHTALESRTLGYLICSVMLSLFIVSHLRGSLYNHTDFYLYPMIFTLLFIFKRYRF